MNEMRERLTQLLSRYFDIGDSYTYNLTRAKSAFAVGTIDLDDFEEYTEDDVANLADYLLENGVIAPQVTVGQTVWFAMFNGVVDDYVNQFLMDIGTYLYSFDEIGKTVFLTREAAEEALKAREKNGK